MTRYVGGDDGRVFAVGKGVRELGQFEWGGQGPRCADLARELLVDLTEDEAKTQTYYRRFLHRTVAIWDKDKAWTYTDADLLAVLRDIEQVEKDTARDRAKMARELPRGLVGAGVGIAGIEPEEWDHDPELVRNDPDKARRR